MLAVVATVVVWLCSCAVMFSTAGEVSDAQLHSGY